MHSHVRLRRALPRRSRIVMGLAIFFGFGVFAAFTAKRWHEWPKAPRAVAIAAAVAQPDPEWVTLSDGSFHCEQAFTEGSFTYVPLSDGQHLVLVGYEGQPTCPPATRPSGAFREASGMLVGRLREAGFDASTFAAPGPVHALFTHEGPGNFAVVVPILIALALIGLAYARASWRERVAPGEDDALDAAALTTDRI